MIIHLLMHFVIFFPSKLHFIRIYSHFLLHWVGKRTIIIVLWKCSFRVILHVPLLESCSFNHLGLMLLLASQLGPPIVQIGYLILASIHGKVLGFFIVSWMTFTPFLCLLLNYLNIEQASSPLRLNLSHLYGSTFPGSGGRWWIC